MAEDRIIPVFISSTVHGLVDLRSVLCEFLGGMGYRTYLSSDSGFPARSGMPPYASCLPVLETCDVVIAIIDKRYGDTFDDWGEYTSLYKGLSPTHAEILHTLKCGIHLWTFVRDSIYPYYDIWNHGSRDFLNTQLKQRQKLRHLK